MNKNILVVLIAGFFVAIMFVVIVLLVSGGGGGDRAEVPAGKRAILGKTKQINVNDFFRDSVSYGQVVSLHSDSDFSIRFDQVEKNFQITFTGGTLAAINDVRPKAEGLLLGKLGISMQEACELYVGEVIPQTEGLITPKTVYELSFCPGGNEFPK